jgi:hypothetical protein
VNRHGCDKQRGGDSVGAAQRVAHVRHGCLRLGQWAWMQPMATNGMADCTAFAFSAPDAVGSQEARAGRWISGGRCWAGVARLVTIAAIQAGR